MTRRTAVILTIIILAAGAFALWRPDLVLTNFERIPTLAPVEQPSPDPTATSSTVGSIVTDIRFDAVATSTDDEKDSPAKPNPIRKNEDRLIVPSMGVNAIVYTSASQKVLSKGLWHIEGSPNPGEPGNIVIAAHRWLYKPPDPRTFYLVDKVKIGDTVTYVHEGISYEYVIDEIRIVEPEDVSILDQDQNRLTLFTCHPLYSTKQRIALFAKEIGRTPIE